MKHTPGKWKLGQISDTIVTDILPNTNITEIHYYGGGVIAETVHPRDRHLISAAPEMFFALSEVMKYHKDEIHRLDVWELVEKALEKAKGEIE